MRIGIEGQRLYRKNKHGMDMVALELIKNLQLIDAENDYFIFVKPDVDNLCIPQTDNFNIIEIKGGPFPIWEQILLPMAAQKYKCDVLHCTSNTAPLFCNVPVVTIIHDVIFLENNSLFSKGGSLYQKFGNMYRRWLVPLIAKKSKMISTVSEFERNNLIQHFGFGNKIITIHNGVSTHFKPIKNSATLLQAKEKYNLPDNFILFFANTDPRKNTYNAIKAFTYFNQKHPGLLKLIMLDYSEKLLIKVLEQIGTTSIRNEIQLLGYVPNNELPAILNLCKLFLFPSLRESFGIPILEAMACGVPVIASNSSSIPEIAGNAALLVDPNNPQEISAAIEKLMTDSTLADEMKENGKIQARKFSWKKMAHNYLKIYNEVSC